MNWQYRTILFEFQKDGLLGDKYIDDDEMEQVLNDYGRKGWELVSVTPVQEGLLSFFKRTLAQPRKKVSAKPSSPSKISERTMSKTENSVSKQQISRDSTDAQRQERKEEKPSQKSEGIGEIKIS